MQVEVQKSTATTRPRRPADGSRGASPGRPAGSADRLADRGEQGLLLFHGAVLPGTVMCQRTPAVASAGGRPGARSAPGASPRATAAGAFSRATPAAA